MSDPPPPPPPRPPAGGFVSVVATLALLGLVGIVFVEGRKVGRAAEALEDAAAQTAESIAAVGGAEFLAEPAIDLLVDRLNESGVTLPPLDPDDPLLKQRTVLISEGMNERVARHVITRLIWLDEQDSTVPIELKVSTPGGWPDCAFAIVDTMRQIEAPVNVTAIGGCYSAGTLILAAATGERAATPNALMSVHVNDYLRDGGDLDPDVRELARFRELYRLYTDVPQDWFDEPGDNQYYLNAEQALRMRLIDKIAEPRWRAPAGRQRPAVPAA